MVYISKEQVANLTRYNNFRMNESMVSIIFDYLEENSLDYGINGSFNYLNESYKSNNLESLRFGLEEEIKFLKKQMKDMINSGDQFSKEFKVFELILGILEKIYKFVL